MESVEGAEWLENSYGISFGFHPGAASTEEKPFYYKGRKAPAGWSMSQFRKAVENQEMSVGHISSLPFRVKECPSLRFATQGRRMPSMPGSPDIQTRRLQLMLRVL